MKQRYRSTNFRPETLARIEQAESIIEEYGGQKLTARQVYYQFVARDLIPNTPRSYQNLTAMLTDARYAGLISWDAIEDRGREVTRWSESDSIEEDVDYAVEAWRSRRWKDQPRYVELWVEKQALAGVLEPIAAQWHVPLMVNKGYSSASAMHDAAQRMIEADREVIVLYLGDHDPSGEDMVRDIRDRLEEFEVPDLDVRKIALTMPQIRRFRPPPNPAKITDSRAAGYIAEHGRSSWELDALPPRELNRIVDAAIRDVCDVDAYEATKEAETIERDRVRKAIAKSRGKGKS